MDKIYYPLNDNIGSVQLIQSVGDDTGIVNAARVSLGKQSNALNSAAIVDNITFFKTIKRLLESGEDLWEDFDDYNDWSVEMIEKKIIELEDSRKEELLEQEKDRKLIKYLLEHDHGTPFEHNSLTFLVKCPIFVARQWMRHRIASFNEISGRYVEVKEEFYIPQNFRKQSTNNRQASIDDTLEWSEVFNSGKRETMIEAYECTYRMYQALLKKGACREQARGLLPLATYTEYYFTCNLRALLHFIKLRDHENAQWEIQQYAKAMKEIAKEIFPETFKIIEELNK